MTGSAAARIAAVSEDETATPLARSIGNWPTLITDLEVGCSGSL